MTHSDADRFERRRRHAREPLSRTEGILIAMFVTLSAAILGAGAVGYASLSGQLLDMQEQIGGLRVEMHEEIGNLSERITRVEILIETHLVPRSDAPPAAGP